LDKAIETELLNRVCEPVPHKSIDEFTSSTKVPYSLTDAGELHWRVSIVGIVLCRDQAQRKMGCPY